MASSPNDSKSTRFGKAAAWARSTIIVAVVFVEPKATITRRAPLVTVPITVTIDERPAASMPLLIDL